MHKCNQNVKCRRQVAFYAIENVISEGDRRTWSSVVPCLCYLWEEEQKEDGGQGASNKEALRELQENMELVVLKNAGSLSH